MNRLEAWRIERKLSYEEMAARLGCEEKHATVRRWCLHPEHPSYMVPAIEDQQKVQQLTLGHVLPSYWSAEKSDVRSRKAIKGGRNGRQ